MSKRSNNEFRGYTSNNKLTKSDILLQNDLQIGSSSSTPTNSSRYLPTPTKSSSDKKEYRVLRLDNGLTALLISDVPDLIVDFKSETTEDLPSENEVSGSESEGPDGEGGASSDETEDRHHSRGKENEEKMGAVGLCVGVGSFSDPWEIPGMAHFLEHMVFMGSKKYPKENDFDSYIKRRGGSSNAGTDCEHTTFYFESQEIYLAEAMDRFAQFFIAPLMKREAMTRERESIESEFQMALPSHFNRQQQLFSSFAQDRHPSSKFTWGNLKTLQENISDDVLHKAVHDFWKRHYSAHRMTLAVQARLPLSTLEEWVTKSFGEIPNNNLPPDDFREYAGHSFDTPTFRRLYWMDPMKDICQVELTWAMPTVIHLYRSKPLHYIRHLLGHEGKGSLLSFLRKKVWALELYTGDDDDGFDHNSMHSLLHIILVLTDAGYKHLSEVLDAVFSYIRMLQCVGPSERLFNELKNIEDSGFHYVEETSAVDYVEDLAESMHFYPPEDYITGPTLYYEYDADAIRTCTDFLKPETVNIIVSTNDPNIVYDKVEPWFGTKYTVSDIPAEWLAQWKSIKPYPEFTLPENNIFLTEDFTLKTHPEPAPPFPIKILSDELSEVWYKPDTKFKLPIAFLYYYFFSPLPMASPVNAVMLDLFVVILKQILIEDVYLADIAHLNFSLYSTERGVVIKLNGFNEKLLFLLQAILRKIATFEEYVDQDLFEAMKKEQTKFYYNSFLKPSKLAKDVRFSIILQTHWSTLDRHGAIGEVTLEKLKAFATNLFEHTYLQSLVQGNYSEKEALEACSTVVQHLKCRPLLLNTFPEMRVCQVPLGQTFCIVKSYNLQDSNSIVTNYYQSGLVNIKTSCIIEILMLLMDEPVYDHLRTKEQLGYAVSCLLRETFGISGFSVTVNCQADNYSTEYVDKRIEAFLKTFSKKCKKTSQKDFQEIRQTLIKLKQCADLHLKEEMNRNWEEIVSMEYIFNRLEREVEIIKSIKTQEIKKWFDDHIEFGNKSKFRKLSIQIVGHADESKQKKKSTSRGKSPPRECKACETIRDLTALEMKHDSDTYSQYGCKSDFPLVMLNTDHPDHVRNIEDFKLGLFVYPVHKNVH